MVSHPENGSDSPIGSDRDRGRDSSSPISGPTTPIRSSPVRLKKGIIKNESWNIKTKLMKVAIFKK